MRQTTITNVMLAHAEGAVETARQQFRITLDFSAASLGEVDRILSAIYFNRDRGLMSRLLHQKKDHEELWEQAKMWGGYVGETLRRKWGGQWHSTPLPTGEISITMKLLGATAHPVDEVYKRLTQGPQQQSLLGLHDIALAQANPAAMHAAPAAQTAPHATVVEKKPPLATSPTHPDSPTHPASPSPIEQETELIHLGIIGFGRIGAEHATWLSEARGIRAACVFDITPARRVIAEERGLRICSDSDALLSDRDINAVLIATPTALHHEHAYRALSAGKHVMIEKPMALTLAHARDLADTAKRVGKCLSVFHNRRWDADYLTLKSAIERGDFGKLINIESRIGQWASCVGPAAREWRPEWRNEASYGGGGLYDWGSHLLDQLWQMMLPARPTLVFAQMRGNVWSSDCDDFARVSVDFDSGAVGVVEINTTTTRPLPRWHVDGTNGSADSPFSLEFDINTWARLTFTPADGSPQRLLQRVDAGQSESQIWSRFAAAIRGEGPPAVTAASVLPTMALLDAARESSRTGRTVDVSNVVWNG